MAKIQRFLGASVLKRAAILKKMTYKMHLSICKNCQSFQKTMGVLEKKMGESMSKKAASANPAKIKEIQDEVIKKIRNLEK